MERKVRLFNLSFCHFFLRPVAFPVYRRKRIRKDESAEGGAPSSAGVGGVKKVNFGPKNTVLDAGGAEYTRSKIDRPGEKAPPLLDQLNRIDLLGFNRFVEAIAIQDQLVALPTPRTAVTMSRGKKPPARSMRPTTSDNPPSSAASGFDKGFAASSRRGVTPEVSTASVMSTATSRPHPPPVAPPSTATTSAAPTHRTLHPADAASKAHVAPTRPSTTPHSQGANPHRRGSYKGKPDIRTRTYTTGQGGDEDTIVVKMGQKDMALDESAPPMRKLSDGGITMTESFDEKSVGQPSNVSTDFGSVHFELNKTDKPKAYHNVRSTGDENWCSTDLYRHNPVFDTDQINPVCFHQQLQLSMCIANDTFTTM
jgi:hypothetical protein